MPNIFGVKKLLKIEPKNWRHTARHIYTISKSENKIGSSIEFSIMTVLP